jgi:ABC-2 type transport system ATP-binding protein
MCHCGLRNPGYIFGRSRRGGRDLLSLIEVCDLSREFRAGRRRVRALHGVNLSVDEGETLGVLGENGAGKTTLLRIVSTLLTPTSGSVRVGGYDVLREARRVREMMAVTFGGERGLYGRLTGEQNLEFFGVLRGLPRRHLRQRIPEVVERVGLDSSADRRVETYSKGMRQRLHLAAGWLVQAPIVLLDEPTVGLDPIEAQRTRDLVAELGREGTTIVLTSHVLRDIETLSDRIVMLHEGEVAYDMSVREFMRQTDDVATVTVTCVHDPSELSIDSVGRLISTTAEDSRWVARIQIPSWDATVFAALGDLMNRSGVMDVEIERTSLEDVYRVLASRGRTLM